MQVPSISDIERYPDRYPVSPFLILFLFDGVTTLAVVLIRRIKKTILYRRYRRVEYPVGHR